MSDRVIIREIKATIRCCFPFIRLVEEKTRMSDETRSE